MNRTFTVYRQLATDRSAEQVLAAIEAALRSTVGGSIRHERDTFHVTNGTNNISLAFVGDLTAEIRLTEPSPGIVDVNGTITLKPNSVFWVCAIIGFCIYVPWLVNIVYFVLDPRPSYQNALDRIQFELENPKPLPKPYGV